MIKFDKDEFLKPQIYSTNDEYETRCNVTKEIVDDIKQLQQENQELKKQYCERTDCSGRLGNSKKVDQLEKELEQLKEIEKEHQRINGELRVENKELLDYKKGYFDLQQENKQLKDNWNKLKEYCKNNYYGTTTIGILDKMQELEGEMEKIENGK